MFLNIIVLFNPQYNMTEFKKNSLKHGYTFKKLSLMNQFLMLYHSIKKNMTKIKYDISIIHCDPFSEADMKILSDLEVKLLHSNNDLSSKLVYLHYNRLIIETKTKGTHRLLIETDFICFKEPQFDFSKDFQFGFAGSGVVFNYHIVNNLLKKINLSSITKSKNSGNPFLEYNVYGKDWKLLCPHMNNGLLLIKEDYAQKIYPFFMKLIKIHTNYSHFDFQWCTLPILQSKTTNYSPFRVGINSLLKVIYKLNDKIKNNVQLLHYCGIGSINILQNVYKLEYDFFMRMIKYS